MRIILIIAVCIFLIICTAYMLYSGKKYSDLMDSRERKQYFKIECANVCEEFESSVANCAQACEADMQKQWKSYEVCRQKTAPLDQGDARMSSLCFWDGPVTAVPPDGIPSKIDKASLIFLLPAAEWGNVKAQVRLGEIYDSGLGVPRNAALAVKWYEKAAAQGDMWAQHSLGQIYHNGRWHSEGLEKDYTKALKWYRLAAEQGSKLSQQYIGNMYKRGLGVEQSDIEACFWYELAGLDYPQAKFARQNCVEILTPRQRLEVDSRKKSWNLSSQSSER
jgi:hypothetical protein